MTVQEPNATQTLNSNSIPDTEIKTEIKSEVETPEQINWKKFREQREIERKQREAAEAKAAEKEAEAQALKNAMEAILNKQPSHAPQQNNGYQEEESEDDRINKKVESALRAREQAMDEQRRQREHAETPNRLRSNFNDFNQVCSVENLDYLEYHYPEVTEAFKNAPDTYEKWSAVYKAVKRFVPNTESKKEANKAEKNFSKPQSMTVPGVTQVGDTAPQQLDDKKRADNWARMQKVMRGG